MTYFSVYSNRIAVITMLVFSKRIALLFLTIIGVTKASAQEFFTPTEYGVLLGGSTYFGDLNPNYGYKFIRPAGGLFVRYSFNPYIAIRGAVNYTKVGYDDSYTKNPYQMTRNLNFRSDILEANVMAEFNFFWFATGDPQHRFTPYLTGGFGTFYYEPYTTYNDLRYNLRPLGTEGQNTAEFAGRKYHPFSFCIPVGAGVKYWLGPGVNFNFEIVNRFTFTDYIDDVSTTYVGADNFLYNPMNPSVASQLQDRSIPDADGQKLGRAGKQRGDSNNKDQYLMFQFSLSFQLKTYKCPNTQFGMWQP
ncbi:outer membrane beta-barrel protein [Taibaiella lutea]|uniref:Outer membrane beta-barrel protein n=1 Tax=Taibaiella lutea TaxID=2608001 RepID=A0A5M6CNT7_9BACT|nr:DUF6089 family protein [Taibaiella lutea]KAA5536676.1 outer membrane beta-barrel protein [Taibaiella lutea]